MNASPSLAVGLAWSVPARRADPAPDSFLSTIHFTLIPWLGQPQAKAFPFEHLLSEDRDHQRADILSSGPSL